MHPLGAILHRVHDWDDIRYFLAIARAGTLAQAARDTKVEHTTVGRRLRALESALGTRLFTHGPEGFTLTRAGEAILPLAEAMEAQAAGIVRRVSGEGDRIEGMVRLTTSEAFSSYFVKQLAALRQRHPGLVVEILSGNRAFDLMRGEADLAFRIRPDSSPDLIVRKVVSLGWSIYAAKDFLTRKGRPDVEELAGWDVIGYDESLSAVPGAVWLAEHGGGAHVVLRANSIVAAMNATLVGMGIGFIPCFMGQDEPSLVRLTPSTIGERDGFLVVHPDLAKVGRVRAVMDFIVESLTRDVQRWETAS